MDHQCPDPEQPTQSSTDDYATACPGRRPFRRPGALQVREMPGARRFRKQNRDVIVRKARPFELVDNAGCLRCALGDTE
jgi:hypothetical protein